MSEIKVNSRKGVGASSAAITVNNTDGTCTANITNNLSNRNIIINGAMLVAQRGTSSTSTGIQTVDRFGLSTAGLDEAMTQAQVDVASGTTPYSLGFRKAYKITNGNQTGGAGTSDRCIIYTTLESQDNANAGWNYTSSSSFTTLSFWAKSSVAQTFYLALTTQDGTQQRYGAAITFSSADTWTKFTYKIPGNSNIQFDNNNERGLQIYWTLFRGTGTTDNSFPINQWAAYNSSIRYPDFTSTWFTTNDATFELTGVQLEVGSVATDFEHRSFSDELSKCQRYCQKLGADNGAYDCMAIGQGVYNTKAFVPYRLPTRMRSTPSFTLLGSASDFTFTKDGGTASPTSVALDTGTINMMAVLFTVSTGISNDEGIRVWNNNQTGGYLFTAEL